MIFQQFSIAAPQNLKILKQTSILSENSFAKPYHWWRLSPVVILQKSRFLQILAFWQFFALKFNMSHLGLSPKNGSEILTFFNFWHPKIFNFFKHFRNYLKTSSDAPKHHINSWNAVYTKYIRLGRNTCPSAYTYFSFLLMRRNEKYVYWDGHL